MSPLRIATILLVTGGILTLAYGSFTNTSDSRDVRKGVTELSMDDADTVIVPVWAGFAAMGIGAALLFHRKAA